MFQILLFIIFTKCCYPQYIVNISINNNHNVFCYIMHYNYYITYCYSQYIGISYIMISPSHTDVNNIHNISCIAISESCIVIHKNYNRLRYHTLVFTLFTMYYLIMHSHYVSANNVCHMLLYRVLIFTTFMLCCSEQYLQYIAIAYLAICLSWIVIHDIYSKCLQYSDIS